MTTRLSLFTTFSLIFVQSFSQLPEISSAHQLPQIGDSIFYIDANPFGFNPDGGGGVVDVSWNFQNLFTAGATDFWYVDPATTIEAANFPTATIAQANSVEANAYEYFENTVASIRRLGYSSTSSPSLYYNEAWSRYTFPLQLGVPQSSVYSGALEGIGAGEDSVTISLGNYQMIPDSYGTLMLPSSTFGGVPAEYSDVVRVHVIESFRINVWLFGVVVTQLDVTDDYYFYFKDEVQEALLVYGVTTDSGGGSPQTVLRYQSLVIANECVGDLNTDGQVDVNDFLMFNTMFGQTCTGCAADLTLDGMVDINDFLVLNSSYGSTCP